MLIVFCSPSIIFVIFTLAFFFSCFFSMFWIYNRSHSVDFFLSGWVRPFNKTKQKGKKTLKTKKNNFLLSLNDEINLHHCSNLMKASISIRGGKFRLLHILRGYTLPSDISSFAVEVRREVALLFSSYSSCKIMIRFSFFLYKSICDWCLIVHFCLTKEICCLFF